MDTAEVGDNFEIEKIGKEVTMDEIEINLNTQSKICYLFNLLKPLIFKWYFDFSFSFILTWR